MAELILKAAAEGQTSYEGLVVAASEQIQTNSLDAELSAVYADVIRCWLNLTESVAWWLPVRCKPLSGKAPSEHWSSASLKLRRTTLRCFAAKGGGRCRD
jgi:hypothetical protein